MKIQAKKFNLVAVGRAYTDIIADVTPAFLQAHHIPIDGQRECPVPELKKMQAALSHPRMLAGGASANTVAIVSALGGKAGFFAKVYRDAAGQSFLEDFQQRNVDLCCSAYAQWPEMSATCLVLLTGAHRSFAFNPGCGDEFSVGDFDKFDFSVTDFFLLEAHLLTSPIARPAMLAAVAAAENKTVIVINLQGIMHWEGFAEVLRYITSKANIIVGNQNEQAAFAGALELLQLSLRTSQLVLTTQGANGAEIFGAGREPYHVKAEKPKTFVSAIGAGDAFTAGFLFAQSRGMSIEESMQHGVRTATVILEEEGARPTQKL